MDDVTLLDLLGVPCALKKLDVTAKVLPCQHTFCKPCLQKDFQGPQEGWAFDAGPGVLQHRRCQPACCSCASWTRAGRTGLGERGSFRRPWRADPLGRQEAGLTPEVAVPSPFRLVLKSRIHMDGVRKISSVPSCFPWRLGLCASSWGFSSF